MTWLLSLLTWRNARLALLAALVGWALWGEYRCHRYEARIAADHLQAAQEGADRSENARELERLASRANQRIANELLTAQRERDAAARTAAQRLRDIAAARAATDAAAATCQRLDAPAAALIPGATREALVDLARTADEVADHLRACQAYIREVVRPEAPSN